MPKKLIASFVIGIFIICGLGLFVMIFGPDKAPSEKARLREITGYLDKHLEEPYTISEVNEQYDIYKYEVYLSDEDITVPLYYKKQYNDAVNTYWGIDHFDIYYYAAKVVGKTDTRAEVLKKYPNITEDMDDERADDISVNIHIKSIEDIDDLYDYLIESYKINNYQLYENNGTREDKAGYWYFNDYDVKIHIYVDDQETLICNYYDLREEKACRKEELYNFISKEEFADKCLEKHEKVKNGKNLFLYW